MRLQEDPSETGDQQITTFTGGKGRRKPARVMKLKTFFNLFVRRLDSTWHFDGRCLLRMPPADELMIHESHEVDESRHQAATSCRGRLRLPKEA